jgi:hypothetical protein
MNPQEIIKQASTLVENQHYRITMHAEREREEDAITLFEIEECFINDGKMVIGQHILGLSF